jgi:uncharacterized damage-inducible protein DinB
VSDTNPPLDISTESGCPTDLLRRYADGPAVLRASIAELGPESLRARPIAGKMSSLEVVAHIVDSDQFMCDRMKRTIATDRPLLVGVESADYAGPLGYHDRDTELDLRLIEAQRSQMLADLERLPAQAWERAAIHSEVGLVTLRQLLAHAVDHLESHVGTIADKRAALGL